MSSASRGAGVRCRALLSHVLFYIKPSQAWPGTMSAGPDSMRVGTLLLAHRDRKATRRHHGGCHQLTGVHPGHMTTLETWPWNRPRVGRASTKGIHSKLHKLPPRLDSSGKCADGHRPQQGTSWGAGPGSLETGRVATAEAELMSWPSLGHRPTTRCFSQTLDKVLFTNTNEHLTQAQPACRTAARGRPASLEPWPQMQTPTHWPAHGPGL